jgi:protein-S-isoprenylcysteine O-methyltransferase Ste14
MIPWLVFIILTFLSTLSIAWFVPVETRLRYARSHKPLAFWAANLLSISIPITAAVQSIAAPTLLPIEARTLGAVLVAAGNALLVWAMRANPYFVPLVVKPVRVVREGPYRFCKHPGYAGLTLSALGTFLLLAQFWAAYPLILYVLLLAWRARVESRLLNSLYQS